MQIWFRTERGVCGRDSEVIKTSAAGRRSWILTQVKNLEQDHQSTINNEEQHTHVYLARGLVHDMTILFVFALLPARYVTNIDLDAPSGSSFMILHTMMIVISRKA
jgi:hypothetical protein